MDFKEIGWRPCMDWNDLV